MRSMRIMFSVVANAIVLGLTALVVLQCELAIAQTNGRVIGQITDPSGAVVSKAIIVLSQDKKRLQIQSDGAGKYTFTHVRPGIWTILVGAQGFALFTRPNISVAPGQTKEINVQLRLPVLTQSVTVPDRENALGINPEENASAIVLNGSSLNALSDDPDELRNELQALAGSAAGPNGGEIYIDGFTGGQLPPKSSIREIRVNQNPFSAQSEHLGYGSVEIITKPGAEKFSGYFASYGTTSVLNTASPLVNQQPEYHFYFVQGTASGPIGKHASVFGNLYDFQKENNAIVSASSPTVPDGAVKESFPNPSSLLNVSGRLDVALTKNNTLTLREIFSQLAEKGQGVGAINLPDQSYRISNTENAIQLSDTAFIGNRALNQLQFQWRRIRNASIATSAAPSITVEGAFVGGGNNIGTVEDHQDLCELGDYLTLIRGTHTLRLGGRLRTYRDANYSTSEANGAYVFSSLDQYFAGHPSLYRGVRITNPRARVTFVDGAAFAQDDWQARPDFVFSYGLRVEGQNRIHDHLDFAPRLAIAWAPRPIGKARPKTVYRAGYGWFYQRFIEPGNLQVANAAPYLTQTIHDNGVNEQSFVIDNPPFPSPPVTPISGPESSNYTPSITTLARHFHSALDMQAAMEVDRQLGKASALSVSYLYTRGIHQYFTDEATSPAFNAATYTVEGNLPDVYNAQFASGGVYREEQLITTAHTRIRQLTVMGLYALSYADSDTQGISFTPSAPRDPTLDYGRASFARRNRVFVMGNYVAPFRITIAPMIGAQSGAPYNITVGSDLTENNQFNARPTFGTCGAVGVISTQYGCLDSNPIGKSERIAPYNLGTGPANVMVRLSVSRAFGIGPHVRSATTAPAVGEGSVGAGLTRGGASMKMGSETTVPRRFNLTLSAVATNLVNYVNWGPPNGTLMSPLFGKSQSLAGGLFESPTPGNRTIVLRTVFSF